LALWLPHYLMGVYGIDIQTAGAIAALYIVPASLFRAMAGWLADRLGARRLMYWALITSVACTFLLSYPPTRYVVHGTEGGIRFSLEMALPAFIVVIFALGLSMALGKAAVYHSSEERRVGRECGTRCRPSRHESGDGIARHLSGDVRSV